MVEDEEMATIRLGNIEYSVHLFRTDYILWWFIIFSLIIDWDRFHSGAQYVECTSWTNSREYTLNYVKAKLEITIIPIRKQFTIRYNYKLPHVINIVNTFSVGVYLVKFSISKYIQHIPLDIIKCMTQSKCLHISNTKHQTQLYIYQSNILTTFFRHSEMSFIPIIIYHTGYFQTTKKYHWHIIPYNNCPTSRCYPNK